MDGEQSEDRGVTDLSEINTSDYVYAIVQTSFWTVSSKREAQTNLCNVAKLLQWTPAKYWKVILTTTLQLRATFNNPSAITVPQTIIIRNWTWLENMYRLLNSFDNFLGIKIKLRIIIHIYFLSA